VQYIHAPPCIVTLSIDYQMIRSPKLDLYPQNDILGMALTHRLFQQHESVSSRLRYYKFPGKNRGSAHMLLAYPSYTHVVGGHMHEVGHYRAFSSLS